MNQFKRVVRAAYRKSRGWSQGAIEPFADDDCDLGTSDVARIIAAHDGNLVHKWVHYLPAYSEHFARFRDTPVRFLELGVSHGGSLQVWREYFGPDEALFVLGPPRSLRSQAFVPLRSLAEPDPKDPS